MREGLYTITANTSNGNFNRFSDYRWNGVRLYPKCCFHSDPSRQRDAGDSIQNRDHVLCAATWRTMWPCHWQCDNKHGYIYLDSMVANDPFKLPLAEVYKATENSHPAALNMMTLWRTVIKAGSPSLLAIDTTRRTSLSTSPKVTARHKAFFEAESKWLTNC